jgi:hypothetical protein
VDPVPDPLLLRIYKITLQYINPLYQDVSDKGVPATVTGSNCPSHFTVGTSCRRICNSDAIILSLSSDPANKRSHVEYNFLNYGAMYIIDVSKESTASTFRI